MTALKINIMVFKRAMIAVGLSCILQATNAEVIYSDPLKGKELEIGNLLEWRTASELNSKIFIIEKSSDGLKYENIGTVEAAGESDDEKSYRYLDIEKNMEAAFYRLKQLDQDGSYNYTETVLMKKTIPNDFMIVAMSQTTTDKMFDVTLEAWKEGEMSYSLISYKGELIFEATQWLTPGFNEIQINLENEKEGIYKLNLLLGKEEEKLVIQKRELAATKRNVASKN